MSDTTQALHEYGQAIRGDWGMIDGRWVRDDLQAIASAIEAGTDPPIGRWRERLGICAFGGGHWVDYCDDQCGREDESA